MEKHVTDLDFKKSVYCLEPLKIFLSHDKPQQTKKALLPAQRDADLRRWQIS